MQKAQQEIMQVTQKKITQEEIMQEAQQEIMQKTQKEITQKEIMQEAQQEIMQQEAQIQQFYSFDESDLLEQGIYLSIIIKY